MARERWTKDQFDDDASATVEILRASISQFEPQVEYDLKNGWWSIELPIPRGADYQFSLHGELGGERQIGARLVRTEKRRSDRFFWYSAIEMADFRDDASKLEKLFHAELKHLLECPTKIVEKKGLIWLSYRADYQNDAKWKRLQGGVTYLGFGLEIPFFGTRRVYTSPPIASNV